MANGGGSSAMELRVLINILQSGAGLQSILKQVNQVSAALTALQAQANVTGGAGPAAQQAQAVAAATQAAAAGMTSMNKAGAANALTMASLEKGVNRVVSAVRFLTTGFLALQSVRFLKGLADEAARAEVMATVLHVVAQNAGYTAEQIDEVDRSVQRLGITAEASRNSLVQFMQAKLDLKFAPALARAAQDLAVIAGVNSSDTFRRMIINIQQLDTLGLRWMGIIIDRAAAEQKYKDTHREITGALQKRHQQEALMLEVLEKAKQLEGTYSSAMGDVGKQLTSLERLTTTYRQLLGDSLLPAYSAIVTVITTLLEKMIILSREFSANRERAQHWKEIADTIASVVSEIILLIAKNIDAIATLAEWYIKYKIATYAIAGSAAVWAWVTGVVATLGRFRLILDALRTSQISMALAQKMLAAASNEEAIALLRAATAAQATAVAQTAVATTAPAAAAGITSVGLAANAVTLGLELLAAAWRTLLITFAVPAIAYVGYKVYQRLTSTPTPVEEGKEVIDVFKTNFEQSEEQARQSALTAPKFLAAFEKFKTERQDLVKLYFNDQQELMAEFFRQITKLETAASAFPLLDEITKAKMDLKAAQGELIRMPKTEETRGARDAASERVSQISNRLETLNKRMTATLKAETPLSAAAMLVLADNVAALTTNVTSLRDRADATEEEILTAETRQSIESERLKAQIDFQQIRVAAQAVSDPTRQFNLDTLTKMKRAYNDATLAQEEFMAASKAFFGEDVFTDEGRMSAAFNKLFGPYQQLIETAKKYLESGEDIPREVQDRLKAGMEKLGKAVSLELDLAKLRELVPKAQALPIPELRGLGRAAIGFGEIGFQQAQTAIRAPLVNRSREQINAEADTAVAAAKKTQETVRTQNAFATAQLEQDQKAKLLSLDQYYDARRTITTEGFKAEEEVAKQEILRRRALESLELREGTDPVAIRRAIQARADAEEAFRNILQRKEIELENIRLAREDRRRVLLLEQRKELLDQRAQYGALSQQQEQRLFQIEEELRKQTELGTEADKRLLALKNATAEYELQKKDRERTLQLELEIAGAFQKQLDLRQQAREVEAARDRGLAARGEITSEELKERNNARLRDALDDNRARRQSKQDEIEANRRANSLRGQQDFFNVLALSGRTHPEIVKAMQEEQLRLNKAIKEGEEAVLALDVAWEESKNSAETYSIEVKDTAVNAMSEALVSMTTDFKKAGEVWMNMATTISDSILRIFTKKLSEVIVAKVFNNFSFLDKLLGTGGGGGIPFSSYTGGTLGTIIPFGKAEGGPVSGPGTGTSDSIPAMLSAGEHVMPAAQASRWMPLLEGIRLGHWQSIASGSIIPRRYAGGGMVMTDAGASAVTPGGASGNMTIALHPDALNMTMRDWLEHEVVRQHGRR